MTTRQTFQIGGTTFRFPVVPEDGGRGAEILNERRERVLAAAAKVKPAKARKPASPQSAPRYRAFNPKPGDPGSTIEADGHTYEVWSVAPSNLRWVTSGDTFLLLDRNGHEHARYAPGAQRAEIVAEVAKRVAPRLVNKLAAVQHRKAAEVWAMQRVAHDLYPAHYPNPGEFVPPAE